MEKSARAASLRYLMPALLLTISLCACVSTCPEEKGLPNGFVDAGKMIPGLVMDLRYCGSHNFLGRPVDGYVRPRCILTEQAANSLKAVQDDLRPFGFGLKIFDAYRPERAVANFVRWAKDLQDEKMKAEFYPDVKKPDLFKEEYIAERSSHSRGSTVDLTIVKINPDGSNEEMDMGSAFDYFSPVSWPDSMEVSPQQRANRLLLRLAMEKHGFVPYPKEWWHFTLADEPFPGRSFDFPVE
jgi:zinc D-Ala-D-Ala dipeptidase